MKKVGIVSCYFQKNYGSMLQAYATQQVIEKLGYKSETICIDGIAKEIRNAKLKYYMKQLNDWNVIKGKLGFIKRFFLKKMDSNFKENVLIRDKKFNEFKNTKYKLSPVYNSKKEIGIYCNNYSSVLVGSDQLWLPSNIDANYYTLNFVPENINKIAYATSFGVSSLPKRQWSFANKFLNHINYVSVREEGGQNIIKQVAHREVPVVCDPTLLFTKDEWLNYFPNKRLYKDKYIFCYFLGNNPEQREFADKIRKVTGYKIVSLLHMDEYIKSDVSFPDYAPYDIGPEEFVNLIRNAELVLTDSFHGTVFSVLNGKRFFTFRRFKEGSVLSTNSRMHSLFNLLNLHERFITADINVDDALSLDINYKIVWDRIEVYRKKSYEYLMKALEAGK